MSSGPCVLMPRSLSKLQRSKLPSCSGSLGGRKIQGRGNVDKRENGGLY